MSFQIPDLIKIEMSRTFEGLFNRRHTFAQLSGTILKIVLGLTVVCVLIALMAPSFRRQPKHTSWLSFTQGAWFYDQNTGQLFKSETNDSGPIEAPSGLSASGEPAGLRAHVYSYSLEPKESELFVGFLERPDPHLRREHKLSSDMTDYRQWANGRLIKRLDDDQWIPAASAEGYRIVQALVRPNKQGQTPIYQIPR